MSFIRNLFGRAQNEQTPAPSAEELEEAKKIFFEYSCNSLEMARNDVHFEKYHISRQQEDAWRNEFIAHWRGQLSTEDLTAVQKLRDANAVEAVPDLLAMLGKGDSYAQLRVAEGVWALSYWMKDRAQKKQAKAAAVQSARSLMSQPIQVSERHKIEIERLGGSSPEEYIRLFAGHVV
ncbi:MAG: hypothetical protein ACM3XO_03160 [Bacteroidota bacterium]